ncbi:multidrug resistance-associated protein 7 [Sitophilus oryzae]|uniref:ABC-type xenobiotic transporter n=1 Tax=Sitophilus oryzae TaxID=7048 RepID=A0A6J2YSU6_SITOR|nr:multidrug resistance-associated protein 7 [Sitophilus oryzae]XP_030766382.1 multidrug resistance-associated protein 7 [Sitophilus oryzae]
MDGQSLKLSPPGVHGHWNFTNLCGDEGFEIWNMTRNDLGICFQQLVLDIPVLCLLAISSSYYFGYSGGLVSRGSTQLIAINMRCFLTFLLAFLPVVQIYVYAYHTAEKIPQIAYFLSAVQGISWFVHILYILNLRRRLGKNPRGPMIICVLWCLIFVLTVVSLRSHFLALKYTLRTEYSAYLAYGMSIIYLIVQVFYGFTLIPGDSDATELNFVDRYSEIGEQQPLLHNAYVRFIEDGDPTYLGVAMEDASVLSKLLFSWVEPLMQKGVKGQLKTSEDLFDLLHCLSCSAVSGELHRNFLQIYSAGGQNNEQQEDEATTSDTIRLQPEVQVKKLDYSLVKALHKVFWVEFYSIGILKFVGDCANFASPMILNKLISFIEDKNEDIAYGYLYAGGLLLSTFIAAMADSHFSFLMSMIGFRIKGALITTIYRKTLSVSPHVLNNHFSLGEIVNFMSTDTDRIVNACPSFHSMWNIPFQLAITLYLLYVQVGPAFLAGVLFSIILIPINKAIANKIGTLSAKMMEKKDARVKIIAEVLRGIRAIKLYVWEEHFMSRISRLRSQELKYLRSRKYLDALCVYFWATTPVLISILTFVTYVLMGNKLTAATVFTCIALLNMLIAPLNAFPWVLNGMMEAWVSVKRIQKFLQLPELDLNSYYKNLSDDSADIVLNSASFMYGKELSIEEKISLHGEKPKKSKKGKGVGKSTKNVEKKVSFNNGENSLQNQFNLSNLNLKIRKGEFVGIIGPVGCGKSSILSAVMAELSMQAGHVAISQIESGFGLVTQQPWLQRTTLRDNVLFGKPFDEKRYKDVLFACGLAEDVSNLPKGDLTGVGEGGATLSGGQKARVALARAVYQDKSVYLLDDILSAVDTKVAKHIFQHCILGLLKDKTRILCTHHVQFLAYADRIIYMEGGSIKKQGKPSEILSDIDDSLALDLELNESISHSSSSLLDSVKDVDSVAESEKNDNDSVLNVEVNNTGTLSFNVYTSYWKAIGHLLCLSILMAMVLMQVSRNMTDWWLAHWVTDIHDDNNATNITNNVFTTKNERFDLNVLNLQETTGFYLKIYAWFAVANTLFTLFRAFLFAYGGVVAAAKFHKLLLKSVVKARTTFFDITPLGRILNRFSSDTYTVDDSLPFILNVLLAQFFGMLGSIGVTIYGLPWICLLLVPLIPVYHWLQNYYRLTSRELKRISSSTLSPVYGHFNETLQGLTTINALRSNQRFKVENMVHVDANIKAQFASQAATRWLGLRLQFIGVAIVTGVSFIAVVQHQYAVADPGLIGLAISYALTVTGLLRGVIHSFTETEQEMIAVERVNQYIQEIPLESTYFVTDPPFGWPNQGVVSFNNVVVKYREHLAPSLMGISFETRPCEKIGVVGRTGAGKSSLIAALFRLVGVSGGEICIDSVNVAKVSLSALRSRLFCIPQDPFLFSGTLKENLDPLGEFTEHEIWSALSKVNLETTIKNLGGLNNSVDEGGVNFSVGQKQLICLARAVLHNAKILCIDEATANVDQETDRQVQLTLRSAFRKSTVLTIAHRVQTIMDSDRVLVMHEGKIVEFDTPDNLLANESGYFSQLVNQDL